jgi:hypothetical protein
MQVITNNVSRPVIYGYELTDEEKAEFDHLDFLMDDGHLSEFFRYKGEVYEIRDFQMIPHNATEMFGWDGYISDTFFSGILIKYTDEFESVIVGRYYA